MVKTQNFSKELNNVKMHSVDENGHSFTGKIGNDVFKVEISYDVDAHSIKTKIFRK